jgi:hypothetical protein
MDAVGVCMHAWPEAKEGQRLEVSEIEDVEICGYVVYHTAEINETPTFHIAGKAESMNKMRGRKKSFTKGSIKENTKHSTCFLFPQNILIPSQRNPDKRM